MTDKKTLSQRIDDAILRLDQAIPRKNGPGLLLYQSLRQLLSEIRDSKPRSDPNSELEASRLHQEIDQLNGALTSRENQILTLCGLAGVDAEEHLEDAVRAGATALKHQHEATNAKVPQDPPATA